MSEIRVLRVQSRICVGGPALNTILLSERLDPDRYRTILVGGRLEPGEKSMEPLAHEKGVAIHLIEEMGRAVKWSDDVRALWRLIQLIRLFRPHIVHTHTAKAGAIGRLAAWLCRVPRRVHTFHGHVFHGYFSPAKTRLYLWLERALAAMCHRIVVISPRQREDIVNRYRVAPARKCETIPLGFELDKIAAGEPGRFRQKLGLPPDVLLAGILARLAPIKNHQLLLRAIAYWQTLAGDAPARDVRFLIIGDGELRGELEGLAAELGVQDRVLFTGWQGDVPDIYADLDLNLLVSKNEGTPVTLIEGLACGVPVLATDAGGVRDFIDEDCGVIVPVDASPEDLGRRLHDLLADPARLERMGRNGPERMKALFGVERLVGDVENLYKRLLKQAAKRD